MKVSLKRFNQIAISLIIIMIFLIFGVVQAYAQSSISQELYPSHATFNGDAFTNLTDEMMFNDTSTWWVNKDEFIDVHSWNYTFLSTHSINNVTALCLVESTDLKGEQLFFSVSTDGTFDTEPDICGQTPQTIGLFNCNLYSNGIDTYQELNNFTLRCINRDSNGNPPGSMQMDMMRILVNYKIANETDISPPGAVTNLNNQSQGTTWIYWSWANPADLDFNHTEAWINSIFYANISNPNNYYNATGLTADTTYEIQTRTVDNVGNINTTWVNNTAKTLPIPNTAPVIESYYPAAFDVNLAEPGNQTFNITYTDQENDSTIRWYVDGVEKTIYVNQTVFNWTGNYTQEGSYNLTVKVSDNEFFDSYEWNLTVNETDISPPGFVTNLSNQSQGITWIYWNWTNPTDADFFQNIIYFDGLNVLNASNNYYNATGLQSNTSHTISINTKDASGNINYTNITNIAKTLENISVTKLIILNITPLNNSVNVSLKQDITAIFSQDMNISTLNNSTVIIKDGDNNRVKGKIIYFSADKKLRFNPHRFLKENETYMVNLTSEIKDQNGAGLDSDFFWNFTTELKDTDNDGLFDINDTDDDNDNVDDINDSLKGINASHIKTDIVGLIVKVNESANISKKFNKHELVQFYINISLIIEFLYPFGQGKLLDLTNISIEQNENSSKGSLIISGFTIGNLSKTFYLDNLSYHDGICIDDADIISLEDISNSCKEPFETFLKCPGSLKNYNCTMNGTRFKITGLNHSAAQQANDNAAPRIELISISYSGTSTVTASLTVITDEDASCKYDTQDTSFNNMDFSMSGSGTQHTDSKEYTQDTSGTYYVLCGDDFGNTMTSSNSISFDADVTESSSSEENEGSSGGTGSGGTGSGGTGSGGGGVLNASSCTENWICDSWSECTIGFQTRKCFDLSNCGTKSQKPIEFQTCKGSCEEIWQCDSWSVCEDGIRKRECYDLRECGTEALKPNEYEECEFIPQCYNLIQDNGEEGIDCGGPCQACETCFDRIQNQNEEGIDCGGPCRPCRTGDIITTGKNILVLPAYTPNKSSLFIFLIIVVSILFSFKEFSKIKNLFDKREGIISQKRRKIMSKLKNKFQINDIIIKPKNYPKKAKLEKEDDVKVNGQFKNKPEPKHVVPKTRTHTKQAILKHFKEVYKHDK